MATLHVHDRAHNRPRNRPRKFHHRLFTSVTWDTSVTCDTLYPMVSTFLVRGKPLFVVHRIHSNADLGMYADCLCLSCRANYVDTRELRLDRYSLPDRMIVILLKKKAFKF